MDSSFFVESTQTACRRGVVRSPDDREAQHFHRTARSALTNNERARWKRARFLQLERGDVRRLQALRTVGYFEFNRLPVVQRLIPLRLNRGEVNENVLAVLALDESKSLAGIEPLHGSLFSQMCVSFLFELFGAFPTASSKKNKKGCKCGLGAL